MNIHDEYEECFETETGTPTLTVKISGQQRMIAYSSFCDALMEGDQITLRFRDWLVVARGKSLDDLWQQFQMQDVRMILQSESSAQSGCQITQLEIAEVVDEN